MRFEFCSGQNLTHGLRTKKCSNAQKVTIWGSEHVSPKLNAPIFAVFKLFSSLGFFPSKGTPLWRGNDLSHHKGKGVKPA